MENKRPGARQPGSTLQRQSSSIPQRQPGSIPQRRPPVQTSRRYPPPQNATRSRTYPPPPQLMQSRPYPLPHITKPNQAPPHMPKTNQAPRRTPQAVKPRPTTTTQKAVTVAKPEPRFRDALWPATPDAPALNRVAFVCALLYALIHTVCGFLLIHPLNLLTARMPFPLADIVRAFLPALIGAVLCTLTRFPLGLEVRVGLSAYRKLLRMVLTLFVCVLLLMWGEWEALRQVARFVLMFVSAPLITGTGLSVLLFYFDWLYDLEDDGDA